MADRMRGLAIAALLATGCAGSATPPPVSLGNPDPAGLHLELIAEMLERERPLAALAHLDALTPEQAARPESRLLRAEAQRRLGRRAAAERSYRGLLEGPLAAQAWRGLGLLAAAAGELPQAIDQLRRAAAARPTNARIRNDLGYALLLLGDLPAASAELATAVELGEADRAPRNLVLLLLVRGDSTAAAALARRQQMDPETWRALRDRARELRVERGEGA